MAKVPRNLNPLDDDLDLPEVSPKRRDDTQDEAAELKTAETTDPLSDDIALPAETETVVAEADDDDAFAGFGAGLFDASTDELPPRKQVAKAKQPVKGKAKLAAKAKSAQPKPAAPKPRVEEVAAVNQPAEPEESEGGTWDFIAGVLGIGGKKNKADEDTADEKRVVADKVATPAAKGKPQAAALKKDQPKADVKSYFQEPKPAPEAAVDALFNTADDGLDLAGWGDEEDDAEEPVAAKPAKAERPDRSGRGRKPQPAKEDRENRSRSPKSKTPMVDDLIDDDEDGDDENFIEFEVGRTYSLRSRQKRRTVRRPSSSPTPSRSQKQGC